MEFKFTEGDKINHSSTPDKEGLFEPLKPVATHSYPESTDKKAETRTHQAYKYAIDTSRRALKLFGLSLLLICVVLISTIVVAATHWPTPVVGHLFLRLILPPALGGDIYRNRMLEHTIGLALYGALLVNAPSFVLFLLSFPFTFDRTVLEGSIAPAHTFVERITPTDPRAQRFIKYAPRLAVGPVGVAVVLWMCAYLKLDPPADMLDTRHAFYAGLAGEAVLSGLGRLKRTAVIQRCLGRRKAVPSERKSILPLHTGSTKPLSS